VKAALAMLGQIADIVRLPLLPLEEGHRSRLRTVLEAAGLLQAAEVSAAGSPPRPEFAAAAGGTTRRTAAPARA